MAENGVVLGLVGSPNRDGRTNHMVSAALEGAASAGAQTEIVQMCDYVPDACKDCIPRTCETNLRCTYDDTNFEYLSDKIRKCGALVLGTPVYWSDTTGMVKYLIIKMFRCFARNAPLKGLPALGIGVAGGSGNWLITGLRPLYLFFQQLEMRAIEPLPVTRFNYADAERRARELGAVLANNARERRPFVNPDERYRLYDSLPYLSMNRMQERRLLANLATASVGDKAEPWVAQGLVRADVLAAAGNNVEAMAEATRSYEEAFRIFEGR